jgi:hypothetical protein
MGVTQSPESGERRIGTEGSKGRCGQRQLHSAIRLFCSSRPVGGIFFCMHSPWGQTGAQPCSVFDSQGEVVVTREVRQRATRLFTAVARLAETARKCGIAV